MAKDDLYFRLRLPEDLKTKVAEAAELAHRSMTAEIIARLEASFNAPSVPSGVAALIEDQSNLIKRQAELIDRQSASADQMVEALTKMLSNALEPNKGEARP